MDNDLSGGITGAIYDYGFRIYDARIAKFLSVDPKYKSYPHISPYVAFENNPIYFNDPDGRDAKVSIQGNTITIKAKIVIYGDGATQEIANQMQEHIMTGGKDQKGKDWTFKDEETGKVYNVKFDVNVKVGSTSSSLLSPLNSTNYINATNKENVRSYVKDGKVGMWRSSGLKLKDKQGNLIESRTFEESDPAPHEFGHLLGLEDKYINDETSADFGKPMSKGWMGNIMAEPAMEGVVEQKNINSILTPIIERHNQNVKFIEEELGQEWGSGEVTYKLDAGGH